LQQSLEENTQTSHATAGTEKQAPVSRVGCGDC
jgi:hypothetical protein